jgi:ABC-type sugar transport system substrate-binding protein
MHLAARRRATQRPETFMMMTKRSISTSAFALAAGLALPLAASAQDSASSCDLNPDGLVSKLEFLEALGHPYDNAMTKAKQMPAADQGKVIKGTGMTNAGLEWFLRDSMCGLVP